MTNTIKFLDTVIRSIKPENKRVIYWCIGCPSFGLRVTQNGSKSFVFKYRSQNQKDRWITIGKYPTVSVRQARQEYDRLYEKVYEFGQDPVEEEQEQLAKEAARIKVKDFINIYLEHGQLKGKKSLREEERVFSKFLIPFVDDKPVDEVKAHHIDTIQSNILKSSQQSNNRSKSGRVAVKNYLAYIRALFNLAIKKQLINSNPVTEIESLGQSGLRERVLNFKEIWLLWHGLESSGVPPVTANALKFMLVTMQRGIEVRNMKHASIKLDENIWHMEHFETKNNTMHRVPLNSLAHEIINAVMPYTASSPFVFGATRATKIPKHPKDNLVPLGNTALSQVTRKHAKAIGLDDITPHDLRRTAATWITAVGLPKLYAKLMLNHSDGDKDITSEVYVQYSYDFEKRRAVDLWDFVLRQIIECKNVDDVPSLDEMRTRVSISQLI